jgi:RNA polymerase sigma factor (sigma-70 family)
LQAIDQKILDGCRQQSKYCQEQVYRHYYNFLIMVGNRYVSELNDVKMLVNESFFKAFTKIESYENHIPFAYWVRKIMINTCIDYLRKHKKEKYTVPIELENGHSTINSHTDINYVESNIESAYLKQMLQLVPDTSRKVFFLFVIEGYSHKEIAHMLDINEGTSKWHVNNTRTILKAQLKNIQANNKKIFYAE